jgi:hypothetical protein
MEPHQIIWKTANYTPTEASLSIWAQMFGELTPLARLQHVGRRSVQGSGSPVDASAKSWNISRVLRENMK